jgi:transposase
LREFFGAHRSPIAGCSRCPASASAVAGSLPREEIVHEPACSCSACGGPLRRLGEDVSELLEYVPVSFRVIQHIRPKLSCARCERIVLSEAPSRPIARGLAGPGLLAHVLVAKYADHLPLYRQSAIYAREGVELERSTLADWVGSALLQPLV